VYYIQWTLIFNITNPLLLIYRFNNFLLFMQLGLKFIKGTKPDADPNAPEFHEL